jgi:two-component system nitrate/nitrite response regulator NarL
MAQGASDYLLKSSTIAQITTLVQSVQKGGTSIDPQVAKYLLNALPNPTANKATLVRPLAKRDLQTLALLANGNIRKEISSQLNISLNTVSYHVDHIYEKLNVENAPAAIAQEFRSGLL